MLAQTKWPRIEESKLKERKIRRHKLDEKHIYALGWSSSGPPVYATAMRAKTPLTGAFVAMSVFKPEECPPAANAKGRAFYILHSPQDFIQMRFPQAAQKALSAAGAKVKLTTYPGGHGWHGDPQKMIRTGVTWLESSSSPWQAEARTHADRTMAVRAVRADMGSS
jgi:predicted esterase